VIVVPRSWPRRFVCIAPNGDMVGVAQPTLRAAIERCARIENVDSCRCV
jgi:hypothetical protein